MEQRIFNHYKNRLAEGEETRFCAIEYLCQFPKINPFEMAVELIKDGVKIVFDDSAISISDNKIKENKVYKMLKQEV